MERHPALLSELRTSLAKMELALDAIDEALVWTDATSKIEWCNRSFENLAGRPRIDCLTQSLDEVLRLRREGADDGGGPADILQHSPTVVSGVFHISGDDTERAIEVHGRMIPGAVRAMTFVLRDITAARQAARSASMLAAVVDSSNDAIISEDLDAHILTWNAAAERLYGFSALEAVGRSISMVVPAERSHEVVDLRRRVRAGETIVGLETVRQRRDGSLVEVSLTISPLRVGSDIIGYSLIVRDIGLVKTLIVELRRKNEELDGFAYTVAHDLRAPLRQIDGWVHLLTRGYANTLDQNARNLLEKMTSSTRRMGALINGLLELGRLTKHELTVEPVDLSAMANEIIAELANAEPGRQVTASVQPDLRVEGDAALLRSVLVNLLGNAWKFTQGKPDARVDFAFDEPLGAFIVRDNGAGFDMAHSNKLFKAFERLHTQREFSGTGIGLISALRIIERHRGRIWAQAEPGLGASFYFTLPAGGMPRA